MVPHRKYDIITQGKRFGSLVATGERQRIGSRTKYRLVCDCGREVYHRIDVLYRGKVSSCGCQRYAGLRLGTEFSSRKQRSTNPKNLVGKRFGIVTVVSLNSDKWDKKRNIYWNCICDCGKQLIKRQDTLKVSKSCGCLAREVAKSRALPSGAATKNYLYGRLKHGAHKRDIPVDLTFQRFVELSEKDCHWCGVVPSKQQHGYISPWFANGIDRLDNSLGYVDNNCVPCCFPCNRAKRDMTLEEWYRYLDRLTKHHGKMVASVGLDPN